MSALRIMAAAAVFAALLLLALSNAEPVTLRLFRLAEFDAPLALVVLLVFAAGAAAGLGAGAIRSARLARQLGRLRSQLHATPRAPAPHGAVPGRHPEPGRVPKDAV